VVTVISGMFPRRTMDAVARARFVLEIFELMEAVRAVQTNSDYLGVMLPGERQVLDTVMKNIESLELR
jgi:hypothetical protein